MIEADRKKIFEAQTENVRVLEKAWGTVNRSLNIAYANNNGVAIDTFTKILAQIYCAYAEAIFSKIIHTPCGLTLNEISQIKRKAKADIVDAWIKCVELALGKVQGQKSNHIPNTQQKLNTLIKSYIDDPRLLRNKIAHGQWHVALNSENTNINPEMTTKLQLVDSVQLYRQKAALKSLFTIIEDIIESPNKAHRRDYWVHICNFEDSQKKMSSWTLADKVSKLKTKKALKLIL